MSYIRVLAFVLLSCTLQAQEPNLKNITQLTFGGDNAEAYFSPNGKMLSFQTNNPAWGHQCDQIYALDIKKARKKGKAYKPKMISNGEGRTTCSYYMPNGKDIVYASTYEAGASCPLAPDYSKTGKYLWAVYASFDIYVADKSGKNKRKLTKTPGYDAEATVSPKGDKIVFTSMRSGDLELWTMNIDGSDQRQVTSGLGYDGGAFFSPDGKKLVFRASRPQTPEEQKEYKDYLAQGLVAPTSMEIYTCNVDGSDLKQITKLGKANWAPFYHPDGKRIVFASNHHSTGRGFNFQIYIVNEDGTGLKAITSESAFNAFAMFSPDGKQFVWSSNRNNGGTKDTNVFIADWTEE
jgi:TolB protein